MVLQRDRGGGHNISMELLCEHNHAGAPQEGGAGEELTFPPPRLTQSEKSPVSLCFPQTVSE